MTDSNDDARDEPAREVAPSAPSEDRPARGTPRWVLGWALAALLLVGFFALEEAIFYNPPLGFTVGASPQSAVLHAWEEAPDDTPCPSVSPMERCSSSSPTRPQVGHLVLPPSSRLLRANPTTLCRHYRHSLLAASRERQRLSPRLRPPVSERSEGLGGDRARCAPEGGISNFERM